MDRSNNILISVCLGLLIHSSSFTQDLDNPVEFHYHEGLNPVTGITPALAVLLPQPVGGYGALVDSVEYPALAALAGFEGMVVIRAYIDLDSTAKNFTVISGSAVDIFYDSAVSALTRIKWVPGKVDNCSVGLFVDIPFHYMLDY